MTWFRFYNKESDFTFYWEVKSDGKPNVLIIKMSTSGNDEKYTGIINRANADDDKNVGVHWKMLDGHCASVKYYKHAEDAEDVNAVDDKLATLMSLAISTMHKQMKELKQKVKRRKIKS